MFLLITTLACWAPEVEPPAPKLSPREQEALEQGEEFQQADTQNRPPEFNKTEQVEPTEKHEPQKEEPTIKQEEPEPKMQFPFSMVLETETSLLGHGGGMIMQMPVGANLDVLEETAKGFRVICKHCSPNRPFQAGFISKEALLK